MRRVNLLSRFFVAAAPAFLGCSSASSGLERPLIRYAGSSTIGQFVADAEREYGLASFSIDTSVESAGAEKAIKSGLTDLAGVAAAPKSIDPEGDAPIRTTLMGRDAIAVIVHPSNPVRALRSADLKRIFRGELKNWRQLGGADEAVRPLIVAPESATRDVFRAAILKDQDYAGCEVIRPDGAIPELVAAQPGAIGQISFAFLKEGKNARAVAVDGQEPSVINLDYPITRPLYLLWRAENEAVRDFVSWVLSPDGQRVVLKRFVGVVDSNVKY